MKQILKKQSNNAVEKKIKFSKMSWSFSRGTVDKS